MNKDTNSNNNFETWKFIILVLLCILTGSNILKTIEKNRDIKNLLPAIYKSTEVVENEKKSDFDEDLIPLKMATLSDGRVATAYKLPNFDITSGTEPNELSIYRFSDSSILYAKNITLINNFYYGDVMLYDVKTKESKKVLEVSNLQNCSNIIFHMSEKYVVIELDDDFYIYNRATSTGKKYTLNEITNGNTLNQISFKLHNNTLYFLTNNSIATYNIETNEFANTYPLSPATKDGRILGISNEYIVLETYLSSSEFQSTFIFINQNNGKIYSFESLESISVSVVLNYEDKIILQAENIDISTIVFDKATGNISPVQSDTYYDNRLTTSINDFAISLADLDEYSTNYNSQNNLIDLKNSETHPINFNFACDPSSLLSTYVSGNSILLNFSPNDYTPNNNLETYLIIIE